MNEVNTFWYNMEELILRQMNGISLKVYLLSSLGGAILVHILYFVYSRVKDTKMLLRRELLLIMLIVYACFIYQITVYNRAAGSRGGVNTYFLMSYGLLNLVLFIPWGALLAALQSRTGNGKRILMAVCYCFLTSCTIEFIQLITKRGYFELTDLFFNTLGGLAGSLLTGLLYVLIGVNRRKNV